MNPFKVVKAAKSGYKAYKAVKYTKKAQSSLKQAKAIKKALQIPEPPKTTKLVVLNKSKPVNVKKGKAAVVKKKGAIGSTYNFSTNRSKSLLQSPSQTNNSMLFSGDETNLHFEKHAKQIMETLDLDSYNLKAYVEDANYIIRNGTYAPEINAYVMFMGGRGHAKYGIVGLNSMQTKITTFHVKDVRNLARKAPSLKLEVK